MGRPKSELTLNGEPFSAHVLRALAAATPTVVVVAAVGQQLPWLPPGVTVARDPEPDLGPLAGLAAGFAALPPAATAVFVAACDTPLLHPDFVLHLLAALGDHRAAVPHADGRDHPLSAAYRRDAGDTAVSLLAAGERSLRSLVAALDGTRVTNFPHPESLRNVNTPAEYEQLQAGGPA
jgi:molybdopterin-guanine dinucleotide biosynthesis protein A